MNSKLIIGLFVALSFILSSCGNSGRDSISPKPTEDTVVVRTDTLTIIAKQNFSGARDLYSYKGVALLFDNGEHYAVTNDWDKAFEATSPHWAEKGDRCIVGYTANGKIVFLGCVNLVIKK